MKTITNLAVLLLSALAASAQTYPQPEFSNEL